MSIHSRPLNRWMARLALAAFPGFWLAGMGNRGDPLFPWSGILTSALIWPWMFAVLRDLRRRFVAA